MQSEQREKEKRQKDKQEAHLYCHVRIATDADIAQQVGSSQWFDLVDYEKLPPNRTFRVRKLTQFADFKQQVRKRIDDFVKRHGRCPRLRRQLHVRQKHHSIGP